MTCVMECTSMKICGFEKKNLWFSRWGQLSAVLVISYLNSFSSVFTFGTMIMIFTCSPRILFFQLCFWINTLWWIQIYVKHVWLDKNTWCHAKHLINIGGKDMINSKLIYSRLTHWGQVTHMCHKIIIFGSDNGLSPGHHEAIIWTCAGMLLIGPIGSIFNDILIKFIQFHSRNSSSKSRLKNGGHFVSAAMCQSHVTHWGLNWIAAVV